MTPQQQERLTRLNELADKCRHLPTILTTYPPELEVLGEFLAALPEALALCNELAAELESVIPSDELKAENAEYDRLLRRAMDKVESLSAEKKRLRDALEEIRQGCIERSHLHPDAHMRRTKPQIEAIAEQALSESGAA